MNQGILDAFVTAVIAASDYEEMDRIYLKNRIMSRIGEEGLDAPAQKEELIALKDQLVEIAVANSKIQDSMAAKDSLGAELMDWITPSPSQVNHRFWETYRQSKEDAIADFYALSKRNDYIKVKAIAQNIAFETQTPYGSLEITINLSKPEKDPKDIAAAKLAKASHYPACQLCFENEGYQGRLDHPARANHRIIRFDMDGHDWGFQYSPYAYFNEHCIFLDSQHVPMAISRKTFERLLTIVETFPGYFAGSNADLPIVGGSILTHDHYQGGRHTFPMELAPVEESFTIDGFEDVSLGIVNWPMSVLRLQSDDKAQLIALADHILTAWRGYSDPAVQVLAVSDGQPHHTITPIARIRDGHYELDLVLRDNQTSPEHPDGIYHPHADVQHIKKENIGLIEVMGLAILPPRLKEELKQVQDYLLGRESTVATYHQPWADDLKANHPSITEEAEAEALVRESVGQIFARVLEDAGVYKRTAEGQAAFRRFVATL
ncbi:UDP-glucose--hexose-1-phosphate uridylyltransferase [Streptococcus parasanguinis]|uniref:Galactose-1-phosphate uridylyltransferase n=1 Tax=Streptococcus parasanguinis TaxID=1318 RepID=A0A6L6LER8_STRPA|nr:UDP-glucose--hexose-1-phosphate uridylyltransferase [Streptococcus parasanguinis]MTR62025.1 UDP-glucose--hexose-1-phosphate uridylyltransferase [Streptococcus parasanguinis]MTR64425.1 UDP-glucose--hexose-1-phosphate uridylyltransferase [Streptococcus parasanguinis]MTR69043.1 UDP-glucose--hexose-1-phosphate uridylyltransferase [Streptococcus parasanguinis]MTS04548.1 UDP-glucose--hexose-1-phosphate uridylyltransferase [Streptococcus parasanguinis]